MAIKKTPKKKIIANYFPESESDESAEKIRGMQEQIDGLYAAFEKLEKKVAALEDAED